MPISQPSENSINNLPIAEPSQISIVPSPPTPPTKPATFIPNPTNPPTKPVIFIDEPKQTSYQWQSREKTIGGSQVKYSGSYTQRARKCKKV